MSRPVRFRRRRFIQGVVGIPALLGAAPSGSIRESRAAQTTTRPARELAADVVIVGGGLGGCAAALAAAAMGCRVVLTEETDWLGGQLTSQAVPPDEHPWIESFGCTRTYRELRTRIREYYRRNYPLTAEARARWNLNPGDGDVSRLCHEPRVALAVLEEMFAPHVSGGRVRVLPGYRPVGADADRDRVRAVTVEGAHGGRVTLTAPYFVDATELGDLLPLTGTEYVTGAESQAQTGEPHASTAARPDNMQAFTCVFAMDYVDGDHTIDRPAEYGFWREYVPRLNPAWPGRLLDFRYTHPSRLKERVAEFDPVSARGLWVYRRIANRRNFVEGAYPGDITIVNWPQNDYMLGNLCEVPPDEARRNLQRAKQLSLCLLYWLQTEAPRPDGGTGWKGLRLRPDIVGTEDGLAKYPYVREARRICAEFTILEQHVGTEARAQATGRKNGELTAEPFADSVGVGSYRIDLHPSSGGDNYIDISSLPYQIPLGALLPRRVENLLPACKNIGTTHITNGCYRLHPTEWNIGESVGALVAYCLRSGRVPRQVRSNKAWLREFQDLLVRRGVEIGWPKVTAR